MMQQIAPLLIVSLFLGLFSSRVEAATSFVMTNGDVITGELVDVTDETVTLTVEYLGEITLPRERVSNLPAVIEQLHADVDASQSAPESEGATEPHEIAVQTAVSTVFASLVPVLERVVPFHGWEKRLQLGLTAQSGRKDQTDFYYRYDMQTKADRNQLRFHAEYYYGKTEDSKTSDKFASDFRWRQDIGPGIFYQSLTGFSSDAIKMIDGNVEQTLALGTRLVEREDMTISSGLGASGRWRSFDEGEDEVIYLVDVFQDWDYRINDRLRLRQDLRVAIPVEDSDAYEYDFATSLTSEITESINLSLRYELGYDNSLLGDLRADRRFVSTLGYTF